MKVGEQAWIIENGWTIKQVEILSVSGNLYTIRPIGKEGGYRVPAHRLYGSQEEAQEVVDNRLKRTKSQWPWTVADRERGNRGPGLH